MSGPQLAVLTAVDEDVRRGHPWAMDACWPRETPRCPESLPGDRELEGIGLEVGSKHVSESYQTTRVKGGRTKIVV